MLLETTVKLPDAQRIGDDIRSTKLSYRITGKTLDALRITSKMDALAIRFESLLDELGFTCWVNIHPDIKPTFKRHQANESQLGDASRGTGQANGGFWSSFGNSFGFDERNGAWPWVSMTSTTPMKYEYTPYCEMAFSIKCSTEDQMIDIALFFEKYAPLLGMNCLSVGITDPALNTIGVGVAVWYTDFKSLEKASKDYEEQAKVLGFMEGLDKAS